MLFLRPMVLVVGFGAVSVMFFLAALCVYEWRMWLVTFISAACAVFASCGVSVEIWGGLNEGLWRRGVALF